MAWYNWSRTPASNATADATINMAEGMAPSQVNDGIRALMARTAEYRDDIAGAIATTGTSTAYAVTSYSVFDSLAHMANQMIAFTPHTTNGATVTLNVDGLGAKPLRASPNVELQSNVLIQGTPYVATYNNSDAVWYLHGIGGNAYGIPLSGFLAYAGSTAPSSAFVFPYGQAISRTTYATLFSLVASTYGAGDGSTTFNIPDLRGRGIFFKDDMGGSAASRITSAGSGIDAANLSASGGAQSQTLTQAQLPAVAPTFTGSAGSVTVSNAGPFQAQGTNATASASGFQAYVATGSALISTGTFTPAGTISNLGSGNAHPIMPPAYILNCIMRVI